MAEKPLILWFEEIGYEDVPLVGGKNASLGEMYSKLTPKGINVPYGFAVTAEAYRYFIQENHLDEEIKKNLKRIRYTQYSGLTKKRKED